MAISVSTSKKTGRKTKAKRALKNKQKRDHAKDLKQARKAKKSELSTYN